MKQGCDWIPTAVMIAITTLVCALTISALIDYPGRPKGITSLMAAIIIIVAAALVRFLRFLWKMWRSGEASPIAQIASAFRPALAEFSPVLAGVGIIGAFLFSITFLKSMIAAVVPFWADEPLAALDRAFLINPEGIALALKPVLPAAGLFYGIWHIVHLGGILWVLHWQTEARSRFVVSFMLTWGIGMFLAYVFSSAGPIFTGRYDPAIAPESVRRPVEFLWANYRARGALLGGGISAFPSMHVALAAWFALTLRQRGWPKLGIAYVLAIFLCSIILGWHYAADGVAGIAIALVAHGLSSRWFELRRARPMTFDPLPNAA